MNCKACIDRSNKKLSPADIEQMSLPGTGFVVFDNSPWKIIIGYCPSCLSQVAWLVIEGEDSASFARIKWQKIPG